jgi:hypothetical protein
MTDDELVELVGRISNLYTKKSPPFALRDVAKHWLGLSPEEIVAGGHVQGALKPRR